MNGLNAGNDSVNRGSDGLNALLMQRFGADGNEQGGRAAQLAVGGASFRSMLKDRMTNTATESNAGDGRRNAAETERTATGGRVASRSMNHGAAVSAARADSRRTTAADNGKSHGGPVAGTVDDAGNTEAESTREETAGASEDKTGMAQVDVRNGNGRLKIKVKSQDAGEALSAIVAAMLEAIRAAAGETAAETGETVDAAEASGVTAQASTTEGTATTDAAALLKTLEGLLAQVGASATEADGTGDADGFLERLTALLEKAGVGADALKSLSIKFTTDDGSKLMLKLQSLAAGWKNALGGEGTTETEATPNADTALSAADAAALSADVQAPTGESTDSTGQDAARDGAGKDGTDTRAHERNTPTAFAAAFPDAAPQAVKTAQLAQGAGVHAAAAGSHGVFGQKVSELAQAKQAAAPNPLQDPETAKSVTNQVLTRIQTVSGDEKHEMELQLKPENLGKINLRVIEEKGQILAKFTAESQQVKSILESNMQLLKDALEKNGLSVMQLSVSVGQQGGRHEGNGNEGNRGSEGATRNGPGGIAGRLDARVSLTAQGAGLSTRVREYLYGPDSTISLKA